MSVEEMKKAAIEKISALNDESSLKEILDHLSKLAKGEHFMLSEHYELVKQQYHQVLKKLAQ